MSKYPCETCLGYLIRNGYVDAVTRELTPKGEEELRTTNFSGKVCYVMAEDLAIPNLVVNT